MRSVAAVVLAAGALLLFSGVASADPVSGVVATATGLVGTATGLVGQLLGAAQGILGGLLGGLGL